MFERPCLNLKRDKTKFEEKHYFQPVVRKQQKCQIHLFLLTHFFYTLSMFSDFFIYSFYLFIYVEAASNLLRKKVLFKVHSKKKNFYHYCLST